MSNLELLKQSIESKSCATCVYDGLPREICPHVVGYKDGRLQALSFQYGGATSTGPIGPSGGWKCMVLDKIERLTLVTGTWRTGDSHSQPQTCVDDVLAEVKY